MLKYVCGAILATLAGITSAHAQVNVTFLDFEGRAFVETNPTSSACSMEGINFGDVDTIVYRFTLSPSTVSDSLSFTGERSTWRVESTQSPSFSLNGSVPTRWDGIDSRASLVTDIVTTSDLTFATGGGTITAATQNVKVKGTLNDFLGDLGCTVDIKGTLVRRPD
jgi:hypothetical protein